MRLGQRRSAGDRVPRPRVGGAVPRRSAPLRDDRARGRPGRPVLVDDSEEAGELPEGLRGLRSGQGRPVRRAPARRPHAGRGHRAQSPEDRVDGRQCPPGAVGAGGVRQPHRVPVAVRGRQADRQRVEGGRTGAGRDRGIARDEQGPRQARVPLRGAHDLLRVHAGHRHGERPRHDVFSLSQAKEPTVMRIGIIGAGAIGCVVGGLLTKAGHDVTLVDQWPEHIETMKQRGLRLSGTCGEHTIPVKALHIHELQGVATPFEAIFVSVKSYDTEWAAQMALAYLKQPDGVVVDFQNGVNDERVASVVGKSRCLGCVIKIGEHDGRDTPRAQALAKVMNDVAGTKVTTNLWGERWSKLAVNCMANPLAGLSGLGSAEVRTAPIPRRIAIHVAAEVIQVGRAAGYEVEPIYGIDARRFVDAAQGKGWDAVEADMAASVKFLTGGRPSMLQDVMKGRRTEIDYLNGYVSQQGKRLGVPTPVNDAVVAAVRQHGVGTLKPDPKNLEPLVAALPSKGA